MSKLTNFFLASTPSADPRTLTDEDTIEFGLRRDARHPGHCRTGSHDS